MEVLTTLNVNTDVITTAKHNNISHREFHKHGWYNTIVFVFIFLPKLLRFGGDGSNKANEYDGYCRIRHTISYH